MFFVFARRNLLNMTPRDRTMQLKQRIARVHGGSLMSRGPDDAATGDGARAPIEDFVHPTSPAPAPSPRSSIEAAFEQDCGLEQGAFESDEACVIIQTGGRATPLGFDESWSGNQKVTGLLTSLSFSTSVATKNCESHDGASSCCSQVLVLKY